MDYCNVVNERLDTIEWLVQVTQRCSQELFFWEGCKKHPLLWKTKKLEIKSLNNL